MMLSSASLRVLEYVMRHPGESHREMRRGLRIGIVGLHDHLDRLEAAGLIRRDGRKARTLRAVVRYIPVGELANAAAP